MNYNTYRGKKINTLSKKEKSHRERIKKIATSYSSNIYEKQENEIDAKEYYNSLSDYEKEQFNKELELKKVRENYALYLKYVYGDNYTLTRFHKFLAKVCETVVKKVENGEEVRICVSVPPQHGKTTTITKTLPSWFVGRNPDLRCILTDYTADIAEQFGDNNRFLVKKYGKEIFGIEVSDTQDNKTLFNIKDHFGGVFSTGITGSLTSNQGALIIVDDPIKNGVEAENPKTRDDIWNIFTDSIITRKRGKGNAIFIIMTRWHEDDLVGRLKQIDDGRWIFLNFPAIWEKGEDKYLHRQPGETLCPEPEVGFDAKKIEEQKRIMGIRKFNTLYQGQPYSDGGEMVKRTMIKLYDKRTLPVVFDEITMSCDLSFGTKGDNSDPNGIGIWGRVGGNHYLIECINKKMGFTETLDKLRYLCAKYPMMKRKIVESKANGNATIEILNREIGGFVGYNPKESKQARLELVMPFFESGNVYYPDESVDKDSETYIDQLTKFPKSTHDEIVDITTQYLLNYEYKTSGKVITDNKYSEFAKAIKGLRI